MNRKDTIIVAVLVNTALLATLFMMAMHTPEKQAFIAQEEKSESASESQEIAILSPANKSADVTTVRDEIDEVLKHYEEESRKEVAKDTEHSQQINQSLADDFVEITVKKGDYLEKIARLNKTTVAEIMRLNGLANARISIGQVLLVPKTKESANSQIEPEYYTLKSGDNPWKIAKQYNVRFSQLLQLNELDEAKARNLKPGDMIRVK